LCTYLIKHHTMMYGGVKVRKLSIDVEVFNRFYKLECRKDIYIFF
jgi:hypothetical protein